MRTLIRYHVLLVFILLNITLAHFTYCQTSLRINCGVDQTQTDSLNRTWVSDVPYFNIGKSSITAESIAGTTDQFLYRSHRWNDNTLLDMVFTLPCSTQYLYKVNLHFAEFWSGAFVPGVRVFSVLINQAPVLTNYDITADVGPLKVVIKSFNTTCSVSDKILVTFKRHLQNPKVNAIELLSIGTAPETSSPSPAPSPTPVPAPVVDTACANVNCPGSSACCNGACYSPTVYSCSNGRLCPVGTLSCGSACYSPTVYSCCNGGLQPVGSCGTLAPAPGPAPSPTPTPPPPSTPSPSPTDPACANVACSSGLSCCNGACYNPTVYICSNSRLCPVGTLSCGSACYNPTVFTCCNGALAPLGTCGAPSPSHSPIPEPSTPNPSPLPSASPEFSSSYNPAEDSITYTDSSSIEATSSDIEPISSPINDVLPGLSSEIPSDPYESVHSVPSELPITEVSEYGAQVSFPEISSATEPSYSVSIEESEIPVISEYPIPSSDPELSQELLEPSPMPSPSIVDEPLPLPSESSPAPPIPEPSPAPSPPPFVDTACANTHCPSSLLCCGGACYSPAVYSCTKGRLCPTGTLSCGTACYNPSIFTCCNGALAPVGSCASPAPTPAPTPTPPPTPAPAPSPVPETLPSANPIASTNGSVIHVNCGGPAYVDTYGNTWEADRGYMYGSTSSYPTPISLTLDDPIFQTSRWANTAEPTMKYTFTVSNFLYTVKLYFAENYSGAQKVGGRVFDIIINGKTVLEGLDNYSIVGAHAANIEVFTVDVYNQQIVIEFRRIAENPIIFGIAIVPVSQHQAHAVPGEEQTVVDIDRDGVENVTLNGAYSHTHAPAPAIITSYEWRIGALVIGTTPVISHSFPVGSTIVLLTVRDSTGAQDKATTVVTVTSPLTKGLEGYYYAFSNPLTHLPDLTNIHPSMGQTETDVNVPVETKNFKTTGLKNFVAVFKGYLQIVLDGLYSFSIDSNHDSQLYLNGHLVANQSSGSNITEDVNLTAGLVPFQLNYYTPDTSARLVLSWIQPGHQLQPIPASSFYYYLNEEIPVIHSINPNNGQPVFGNKVRIDGYGFVYPAEQMSVSFGNNLATGLTVIDKSTIEVIAPAGTAGQVVQVSVTTPTGTSNSVLYEYSFSGVIPVQWTHTNFATNINSPTCLQFGPDEKLYIGTVAGQIVRVTVDSDNNVLETFTSNVLSGRNILGICFNPKDTDATNIKVYITHNQLYHGRINDDARAMVSIISGADLNIRADLITGLPCSERDHGVNGCTFNEDADLLVLVGSNTNGGLPGPLTQHGLETEKKFSASIAIAYINRPNFDGKITYSNDDAENGQQLTGLDVEIFASGIKNGFNMVLHPNGNLYATDNGPTPGFGRKSTGCNTDGPDPGSIDKLLLVRRGNFYGHPNRARGASDPRQCVYHHPSEASNSGYTAPLTTIPSSMDGIIVYTANCFGGALKNHLITSRFVGELYDIVLSQDGESVVSKQVLSPHGGLNVVMASNGALISTDYYGNKIVMVTPNEAIPATVSVISTFPTRGIIAGGNTLTIYGRNFATGAVVTLGGKTCPVTFTSSRKLRCTIPPGSANQRVGLIVTLNSQVSTLSDAYKYLNV